MPVRNSLYDVDPRTGRAIPEMRTYDPTQERRNAMIQEVDERRQKNALATFAATFGIPELLAAAGGFGRGPAVGEVGQTLRRFDRYGWEGLRDPKPQGMRATYNDPKNRGVYGLPKEVKPRYDWDWHADPNIRLDFRKAQNQRYYYEGETHIADYGEKPARIKHFTYDTIDPAKLGPDTHPSTYKKGLFYDPEIAEPNPKYRPSARFNEPKEDRVLIRMKGGYQDIDDHPEFKQGNRKYGEPYQQDFLYRGLDGREMAHILEAGGIQSKGSHNLGDAQSGLTYFSEDPRQAMSYGSGFAPWYKQATFDKPSYVVKIRRPAQAVSDPYIAPPPEVGVPGSVPLSDIVSIFEIRVAAENPGRKEIALPKNYLGEYTGQVREMGQTGNDKQFAVRELTAEEVQSLLGHAKPAPKRRK